MDNSSRFLANKECEYYPCHKSSFDINCLFCYCPLYDTDCPGAYKMVDKGDRVVKSCIDCTFPHIPGNYDRMVELVRAKREKEN